MPSRPARGVFITLEGGDGSGKSTQATALAQRLRSEGRVVRLTEEPAGTTLGDRIWAAFKEPGAEIDPLAELLFFEAARAQHVAEIIRPALAAGEIVLCDRYTDSSVAYQVYGRGLHLELVHALNDIATGGLKPNLTLLFDVAPDIGLARAAAGQSKAQDAIGQESVEFHRRVRDGYLHCSRDEPERILVVDAAQAVEAVTDAAWKLVRERIPAPV